VWISANFFFIYSAFVIACKEQARFGPSVDNCFIH
jgi:hypothetical protein